MIAQTKPVVTDPAPVIEALFAEARRRRRRIRLTTTGVIFLAAVALALGHSLSGHGVKGHQGSNGPAAGQAAGQAAGRGGRDPQLVWATFDGRMILGDLRTFTSRSVGEANVALPAPMVAAGGRVYWVNADGGFVDGAEYPQVIDALNPRSGVSTIVSPGEYVFPATGGGRVYAALSDTSLAELPAVRGQRVIQLNVPHGWYLPGGVGIAVADGIAVQSKDTLALAQPSELAVWDPRTGRVRPIGRSEGAITAYTPPGAGYGLLAWTPAPCRIPVCPITITNTATLTSRALRSPLGYGFVMGGAFSPNGQQFAAFVNTSAQRGSTTAELAIANPATGAIRLVPQVKMTAGDDSDWVRWLPGGGTLVVQGNRNYLVNTATLAVRPLHFRTYGYDINYSAAIIAPTH